MDRLLLLGLSATLWAAWAGAADPAEDATKIPEKLRPYAALADKCGEFSRLTSNTVWQAAYRETFDKGGDQTWRLHSPSAEELKNMGDGRAPLKVRQTEGRSVLHLLLRSPVQGLVAVGEPVRGEFAVEMLARSVGAEQCDLSILCDGVAAGPGFQFGGYNNTRNILWGGPAKGEQADIAAREYDLPTPPTIERGRWYRVRMEVRGGRVSGSVDGKVLGQAQLGERYDPTKARQVMLYAYGSEIEVDEVRIERHIANAGGMKEPEAWEKVFGKQSRDDVRKEIEKLVALLDDDDWAVRDGAGVVLERLGPMAQGALEAAERDGSPEQSQRAIRLLKTIRPTSTPAGRE